MMKAFLIGAAFAAAALFGALAPAPYGAPEASAAGLEARQPAFSDIAYAAADADETLTQTPLATPASYTPDGRVELAWGAMVDQLIGDLFAAIALALGGLVAWGMRQVPAEIAGVLRTLRVEQLFDKAIQYGINATRGAVKDKVLTVEVGNEVLERAFEYAVRHAPGLLSKVGAADFIREKIIARLNLESNAAVPVPRPPAESLLVEHVETAPPNAAAHAA